MWGNADQKCPEECLPSGEERSLQEIFLLPGGLLLLSFVKPLKELHRCAKGTHMHVGEGGEWKEGKRREYIIFF